MLLLFIATGFHKHWCSSGSTHTISTSRLRSSTFSRRLHPGGSNLSAACIMGQIRHCLPFVRFFFYFLFKPTASVLVKESVSSEARPNATFSYLRVAWCGNLYKLSRSHSLEVSFRKLLPLCAQLPWHRNRDQYVTSDLFWNESACGHKTQKARA